MKIFCFLLFSGITFFTFGQEVLKGKIVEDKNGTPLESASIYINNSSTGTTSNAEGNFKLQAENWANAEMIVSCVGYEPLVFKINLNDLSKNYLIKLTEKPTEMEPVLIVTDEQRRKYLQIFRDNFLGVTEEGDKSKILNLNMIYFIAGTGHPGSIIAKADEPLEIINKKLGYKIHFDLIKFSFDPVMQSTEFYGYTRFESLGDKKKYDRNRAGAYYGSTMHFFKSLAHRDLPDQGFSMLLIKKQKVMNVGYSVTDSAVLRTSESDSTVLVLHFPETLQVVYNHITPTRKYLSGKNYLLPGYLNCTSKLQIRDSLNVYLSIDGSIYNPDNLMVSGYWGYEKAASLLPIDYLPAEEYKPKWIK